MCIISMYYNLNILHLCSLELWHGFIFHGLLAYLQKCTFSYMMHGLRSWLFITNASNIYSEQGYIEAWTYQRSTRREASIYQETKE
jgi:hypothetical protein